MRPITLTLLALLVACEAEKDPSIEPGADADRDGYTSDADGGDDCDDEDGRVNPDEEEIAYDGVDNDCDEATRDDDIDGDGALSADDCDDSDASVGPSAEEIPYDGVDNDCDATTTDDDVDGDGFLSDADCDDTDATVNPDAAEVCDRADQDCDGLIDEGAGETWYADADGDGFGDGTTGAVACEAPLGMVLDGTDCDDTTALAFPGNAEACDELDNNCDSTVDEGVTTTWYIDSDGDGFGEDSATQAACDLPTGYSATADDCDDVDPNVSPASEEICNTIDDDCDGTADEGDAADATTWYADLDGDGYGDPGADVQACLAPDGYVADDQDCDDADAARNPDTVWYIDYDRDGYGSDTFTLAQCEQPANYYAAADDCDDGDDAIHPGAIEVCNGADDDCDALVDDADDSLDGSTTSTWYADTDGDGYGDAAMVTEACDASGSVADATDCDDTDGGANPGAEEGWFDAVDSDCDGALDPDACVDDPPPGTVAIDGTCTWAPTVGTFTPVDEWSVSSFATYASHKHVIMTPVVGQLTDDDGDGDLDADDTPDIAFVAYNRTTASSLGVLRVISGEDGAPKLDIYNATYASVTYYPYRYTNIAIGDIDNDGAPDIVATVVNSAATACYPGAYELDGTLKWVDTTNSVGCRSHAPALADLEGDGDVEVIFGRSILNGADGSEQAEGAGGRGYYSAYSNSGFMSFAADMDGDGQQEVIAGSSIYSATGATVCATGDADGYPGVADLDGDGDGELVVVAGGTVRVYDHACTELASWTVYGGGYGGPPTIADYDGDGTPEIGLPGNTYYSVYEASGTRLWARAIDDASSHSTGSAVFDFDGDGQAEVVYADQSRLWVFDGATGTVLLEQTGHASGTVNEYPVIADVDGDGNAEIIVPNDNTAYGIAVYGDADDNWVSARQVWNQHAYNITNVNDDLSIPSSPESNWPDYNSFRQGAPGSFNATDAPNVFPVAYTACQASCGDTVTIYVQVANDGLVRAASSVTLLIYGESSTGARTLLESTTLGSTLDSGDLSAPYVFAYDAAEVTPYTRLVAVVDEDAGANECDEADNEAEVDIGGVCE
ncbi:MAG: MopE-related protein [Pseudomonadota bacterium]|nr:MopE-related protein [Pseudomonadota bacterium]